MKIPILLTLLSPTLIGPIAFAATSPYRDEILADTPLAYYEFDETSGTTAADSITTLDGTYTGSLGFSATSFSDNLGTAIDFTGGHVAIPNLGTYAQSTIEMWVQFDAVPGGCCGALLAANGWDLGKVHLNGNTNQLEYAVNGETFVTTTAGLTASQWYHLVVTNDVSAAETNFYLNGALVADTGDNSVQDVVFGVTGMRLGDWDGQARSLDGRMDEVAIYDSVLSAARVQAHYDASTAVPTPVIDSFTVGDGSVESAVGIALPTGGGLVTLTWDVGNVDTVEIDNGALSSTATPAGDVTVNVTSDTIFTLTAMNSEGSSTSTVEIFIDPVPVDPRLNEFMAENDGFLLDGNGKSSDWVEIYNPNGFPLDLVGHQLSDAASTWTFPASSYVPALGYLVVFASGNDGLDVGGRLHASFSLENAGEYLAFLRVGGAVIDEYSPGFPRQFSDISYGMHSNPTELGYFVEATPGSENGVGFEGLLDKTDDTTFAFGRGFYTAAFDETITAVTPGASIIYTLDGSVPSETNGTRVDAADGATPPSAVVAIDGATHHGVTTLRALVLKDGFSPTNVDTQTYVFSSDVPTQSGATALASGWPAGPVNGQLFDYGMNLNNIGPGPSSYTAGEVATSLEAIPTVSLVTDLDNLVDPATGIYVNANNRGRNWERPVSVELIYPDGYVDPDGNLDGFQIDAGLRIRGGASRGPTFFKHGFRLFFRGEYGDTKLNFPLFGTEGVDEFDKVDLRSPSNFDWARESDSFLGGQLTFARDVFSRDSQGAMGQPYTKSRYYHLYLNGTYWGIYQTEERPEASFGASYFGGDSDDYDTVKSSNHVGGFTTEATDGTLDAFEDLWNKVREIGLGDPSNANYFALQGRDANGVRDLALPVLLDVDNLIDYMLVIFWTGDGDAVLSSFLLNNRANNWFGVRNRNGTEGFRFFAHDAEHTLGTTNSQVDRTGPFVGSNQNNFLYANPQWMHQDLMANSEYRLRFADRIQEHLFRNGPLTEAAALTRLSARAGQVREALKAYAARWGDAIYLASYNTGMWEDEIAWIADNWLPGRTAEVLAQLRLDDLYPATGSPLFENSAGESLTDGELANGFQLHLTEPDGAPGGTIYYTLDGSDPRTLNGPEPIITTTLLDFGDTRAYHVPTTVEDGFLSAASLSAVPLAHYSFDTDAADGAATNGAQDGTLFNGASISGDAHTGSGALLLDGTDDYVGLGNPIELQITGQISIATWVKANAVPAGDLGNILAKGYTLAPNSEIYLRYAAQVDSWRIASWDGTVHGADAAGAGADLGEWVHLVGTYDGTNWNLYRNGVLSSSVPDAPGAIAVSSDWAIGAHGNGGGRFFNGYIDEMYLFDTALNAEDVTKLYTESTPIWQLPDYAPAAGWATGAGGHGYDVSGTLSPFIGTDVGVALKDVNSSLLTRANFNVGVGGLVGLDYLEMNVVYDAGFVAYLNGVEVHRANAPVKLDGEALATAGHAPASEVVTIDLSDHLGLLQEGSNLLAVHSMNDAVSSGDHLIHYQLRGGLQPLLITPEAIEYTGPLTISGPTTVNMRQFLNGEWSPLNSAVFHTGVLAANDQNLVVSQFHYHPTLVGGETFEAKDYEFVEILNIGLEAIDLSSLHFREEISFDFSSAIYLAPGERAQIVSNIEAFEERYSASSARILGQYSGHLSNGGGRLHLLSDSVGSIRDFIYQEGFPWPSQADGDGYGLVLIQPSTNPDHTDPFNWRRSAEVAAQPGVSDAVSFAGDPNADGDGDGLSALLEYALGTSDAVYTVDPWTTGFGEHAGLRFEQRITRQVNADDILWISEISSDLQNWSSAPERLGNESILIPNSPSMTEIYWPSDLEVPQHSFIRVRVIQR